MKMNDMEEKNWALIFDDDYYELIKYYLIDVN